MSDINSYSKIILELISLRMTDQDAFMDRLYDALTGEFRTAIHDTTPVEGKVQAIWTMINHFQKLEAYEKCAELKKLVEQLEKEMEQVK
jgi:hypothetical protein